MGDENTILYHRQPKDFGVGDAVESGRQSALEIYGRFVAQHTGADRTAKIVICLEPGLHRFRVLEWRCSRAASSRSRSPPGKGAASRRLASKRCFWRIR